LRKLQKCESRGPRVARGSGAKGRGILPAAFFFVREGETMREDAKDDGQVRIAPGNPQSIRGMDDLSIEPGCNRRLQKRRKRHNLFGKRRRAIFLEHLAATCNVQASAAAAGVAVSTVYATRMRDPGFRADWQAALEQGYARLEAALVERATRGAGRAQLRGDKIVEGPDSPEGIDWEKGMELLRHHQRGLAGFQQPGRAEPRRVPIEQVGAKLIRKLKALGLRPKDGPEPA
jgi:hypothetical protein